MGIYTIGFTQTTAEWGPDACRPRGEVLLAWMIASESSWRYSSLEESHAARAMP